MTLIRTTESFPLSRRPKLPASSQLAALLVALVAVVSGVAACSSKTTDTPPPTIEPAAAAVSPPAAAAPAGMLRPLGSQPRAALFDASSRTLVVLVSGANPHTESALTVLGAGAVPPRTVALPGPATALADDGHGVAYLSTRGGYFVVDLAAGTASRVDVNDQKDTDFTAIARRADGKLVLGSADGAVFILSSDTTVGQQAKIFARVDSIVTHGDTAVVLDRGQTSVTAVGPDGRAQQSLRAGDGATTMATDPAGRVLVADTRGDELMVFGVDPLIMRQRYPVPMAPYGLAGSSRLAWVSQTAANVVVGYDLSTGIPVEKVRYPTVQQPNFLAFDDSSDTLYVISGSGAGVQVIDHAAGPQ
jgi:DNA-binding beta-propeller fold protein YncE